MKYSQTIGVIAAILVMAMCFFPWITIEAINKTFNGFNGKVSETLTFGTQYKAHFFFCIIAIFLFLLNKVNAKRFNMFFTLLNFSWALKNFIVFRFCRPECPTTHVALYALVFCSLTMLAMSLLPKMALKND